MDPANHILAIHNLFLTLGRLAVALILVALVQADHIIDDSNTAVVQYGGPSENWVHLPIGQINSSELFNNTLSHSFCITTDDCYVIIPFDGTGINVYNVIRAQLNISFTLDGGSSSSFVYEDLSCFDGSAPSSQPQGCYNISVYNAQSLTYDSHTLKINMFSYLGPISLFGGPGCDFYFDYAVISSPTLSSAIPSHSKPSAIIGGVLGSIAAAIAVVLTVLLCRKGNYWRRQDPVVINPEPLQPSLLPTGLIMNQLDWPPTNVVHGDANRHSQTHDTSSPIALQSATRPNSQTPSLARLSQPAEAEAAPASTTSSTLMPMDMSSNGKSARLSKEQSALVQDMIRNNVPLPTVVDAMEGILRGQSGGEGSSSRLSQTDRRPNADGPPVYDFV